MAIVEKIWFKFPVYNVRCRVCPSKFICWSAYRIDLEEDLTRWNADDVPNFIVKSLPTDIGISCFQVEPRNHIRIISLEPKDENESILSFMVTYGGIC